jgi:hypothetical protein
MLGKKKKRPGRASRLGPALLLILACLPATARGEVDALPIPLPGEGLDRMGQLTFLGGLVLADDRAGFGGFSALEVSPDGRRLWALSDQGRILTAGLRYDHTGRLTGLDDARLRPILDTDGRPVPRGRHDSEGLARLPDGGFVISFEATHRLALHAGEPAEAAAALIPAPPGLRHLIRNQGIEAVTFLADERLLILAESRLRSAVSAFPGWLNGPGGWQPLIYLAERHYRPTGAATLPSGDIVVIERRDPLVVLTGGRIVLVPRSVLQAGATVSGIELGRLVPPALNANYEGIAAWRDGRGRTRLLVISDNNFLSIQRTLLLQFAIDGGG